VPLARSRKATERLSGTQLTHGLVVSKVAGKVASASIAPVSVEAMAATAGTGELRGIHSDGTVSYMSPEQVLVENGASAVAGEWQETGRHVRWRRESSAL
jgi:hypothetical protein